MSHAPGRLGVGRYDHCQSVRTTGHVPLELATPIITVPVGEVRLTAPSGPWLVKVARVEAPGTDSYAPSRTF